MTDCAGSGRELPAAPPPNEAVTCPVCGRETQVEAEDTDHGSTFTVTPHQQVG